MTVAPPSGVCAPLLPPPSVLLSARSVASLLLHPPTNPPPPIPLRPCYLRLLCLHSTFPQVEIPPEGAEDNVRWNEGGVGVLGQGGGGEAQPPTRTPTLTGSTVWEGWRRCRANKFRPSGNCSAWLYRVGNEVRIAITALLCAGHYPWVGAGYPVGIVRL